MVKKVLCNTCKKSFSKEFVHKEDTTGASSISSICDVRLATLSEVRSLAEQVQQGNRRIVSLEDEVFALKLSLNRSEGIKDRVSIEPA